MDSALNHPEIYLKGVIPPRDMQNTRKNRIEDLNKALIKNVVSTMFCAMELATRSKGLHDKAGMDDSFIKVLKESIEDLKNEKAELEKQIETSNSTIKAAEEKAENSERKMNVACKALASKEEELVQKDEELSRLKAELTQSNEEQLQLRGQLEAINKENNDLKDANSGLKREVGEKSTLLLDMQQALDEADSKANKDLDAQFNDFVKQMEDARNEYFLDGWEAAMQRMKVEITSAVYKNVPFPNPDCQIPKFSFEREAQTPSIEELAEQLLEEEVAPSDAQEEDAPEDGAKK